MAIVILLLVQRRIKPLRTNRYLYRKSQDNCKKFGQPEKGTPGEKENPPRAAEGVRQP